jgi:zinc and cadmium transporter
VSELGPLAAYTGAILVGAFAGGAIPLLGDGRRSDLLLSLSAGMMLGAAFFHMLPEAAAQAGMGAIPWVLVGFLGLFLLERFVLVHVCGEPTAAEPAGADHSGHAHGPGPTGCDVHPMGMAAFVGLSLHTLVDGFALGAASARPRLGLLVFIAILVHKIPSSFSLTAILRASGYRKGTALALNAVFALMVPLGAALFLALRSRVDADRFTALALAASAGTFLHLALSDILPDLHRRGGGKLKLTAALLVGVAAMWALRLVHAD